MDQLVLGAAIIAAVEGVDIASGRTLPGTFKIALAAILGLLAGIAGLYLAYTAFAGLDPLTGLLVGLASSGSVTLVKKIQA